MFFTVLDSKQECFGYYYDGDIHEQPPNIADNYITWEYSRAHHQEGMEYLSLYCGGSSLTDLCPPHLQEELDLMEERKRSYANAIRNSKIEIDDVCIYELIPHWFLKDYSQIKCEIMQDMRARWERPASYDFMLALEKLFGEIAENKLKIDISKLSLRRHQTSVRNFIKKYSGKQTIRYNQFGTKTGRLTTKSGSFPILNLERSLRQVVSPNNDLFVEFDYNAAELRTMMALANMEQPKGDVHQWNMKNIFNTNSRSDAKTRFFAWLYNPSAADRALDEAYNRKAIVSRHWDGKTVKTPFGRLIEAQEHYALNYIIQSTTNDLVLEQILKVRELLQGKRSKISFLIHDSFVIDLDKNEKDLVSEIAEIFSQNKFGDFMVNIKAGKDFGNMKEISV